MKPLVSIVMGSISDLPIMQKAAEFLNQQQIPFQIKIISAHRTPEKIVDFIKHTETIKVIIAGAGGAAHLPGVIAAYTHLPVIGVPIKASISIDGWDSILSILQMPPGVPVATVGLNAAKNAAILAMQILATSDNNIKQKLLNFKNSQKQKVEEANKQLENLYFEYKTK